MTRTAAWLTLGLLLSFVGAQSPTVILDGTETDVAGLDALLKDARTALQDLEKNPPADAAVTAARKKILEAEVNAIERVVALLRAIEAAPKETAEFERRLTAAKTRLTEVRNAGRTKPSFPEITKEQLDAAEAALTAAESSRSTEVGLAKTAEDAVKKRVATFQSIAAELTRRTTALDAVRQETATDEGKADLTRRVRTAELELRILEKTRDHHQPLLKRDQAFHALKAQLADVAVEEAKNAQARAAAAREAWATALDAEKKRKEEEARRKEEEARNASPARGAVLTVESLVSALEAAESGEISRKNRVRGQVTRARAGLERVRKRNVVIERLFPAGAELDGWKVGALKDEVRRLETAQRVLENSVHRPAVALATESREWFRERDRLEEFVNLIEQVHEPIVEGGEAEGFTLRGVDEQQDRYLEAVRTFNDPNTSGANWWKDAFDKADSELKAVAERRIAHLSELDAEASQLFEIHADLEAALAWRRRYLTAVSLWIKSPPPFSEAERKAAFEEVSDVGVAIAATPGHAGEAWNRWSAISVGAVWLPTLLGAWIIVSLLGGPIIARRLRTIRLLEKPNEELDPLAAGLKIAVSIVGRTLPSLLLLLGAAWLAWVELEGDPAAALALAAVGTYWLWRSSGVLADVVLGRQGRPGLVTCEEKTSRRARRISLLLMRGVAVLFPTGHLMEALGHDRLAAWFYVSLGAWSVLVSAWLIVRRDALLLIVPKEGGLLARTFRALLPYLWPVAVAFYGGVVVLAIRGYRNAAWHYGSRFLLCAGVLLAGAIAFQIVAAILRRRLGPRNEQEERALENPNAERATTRLVAFRILTSLAFLAVAILSVLSFSAIFELEDADWEDIGNHELMKLGDGDPLRLGDVVQAIFVLIAGLAVSRWVRDSIRVIMASRMQRGSRYVVRTLVYYSLVAITIVMAFAALGLDLDQLGWFLAAAGVGIGFGLQEVISNFIAGLILFFERPVQVGDIISVGAVEGDVTRINIRSTEVRTRDGISIIIPNKRFITDDVINWSHGDSRTRLRATVGVAYGSDVELVKKVLTEVGVNESRALSFPPPEVNFREFGESELSFELMVWLKSPDPTLRRHVTTALNSAIDEAFRQHGIQIPFPQRDLHLKSNEAGLGE